MGKSNETKRTESEIEVKTYLDRLKYALANKATKINFIKDRDVEKKRDKKYTNRYTLANLFPDEDEIDVLKRELLLLTVEDYVETVKDTRFPKRSEMRVFTKQYNSDDVYIKIRMELASAHAYGDDFILVMSFHYAERAFSNSDLPYKKV